MANSEKAADPRYPDTYAADYVRLLSGYSERGTKLSHSDAIRICEGIANVIGMDEQDFKRRLADHLRANAKENMDKCVEEITKGKLFSAYNLSTTYLGQNFKPSLLEE
jgi:hypothetical protein